MASSPSPSSGNETTGFSNVTINTLSIEADEAALESMIACLIFHGLAVLYGILISIYRSRLQNRNNRRYGSAEWFLVGINLFPTFVTVGMFLRIGYLLFEVLITRFVVTVGALYIWTFLLALYLLGTLLYI